VPSFRPGSRPGKLAPVRDEGETTMPRHVEGIATMSFKMTDRFEVRNFKTEDRFLKGVGYLQFLANYHKLAAPGTYFEIGTNIGHSFRLASCRKVAVDPEFKLKFDPVGASPAVHLFQTTSDEFFRDYDLANFLPGGVDLAFLDGLHLFEFLLRDFMNAEKFVNASSVFFLHDCFPVNDEITPRVWTTDGRQIAETRSWWAGDVWKLLPILRHYRPDLEVQILDCPPTGLVVIRGMNPKSTSLKENYDTIIDQYSNLAFQDYGQDRFYAEFPITMSESVFSPEGMRAFFRLRGT
jgi:hypothetical protein